LEKLSILASKGVSSDGNNFLALPFPRRTSSSQESPPLVFKTSSIDTISDENFVDFKSDSPKPMDIDDDSDLDLFQKVPTLSDLRASSAPLTCQNLFKSSTLRAMSPIGRPSVGNGISSSNAGSPLSSDDSMLNLDWRSRLSTSVSSGSGYSNEDQHKTKKHGDMITFLTQRVYCPSCSVKERSLVVSDCGHSFCKECAVVSKSCPQCDTCITSLVLINFN